MSGRAARAPGCSLPAAFWSGFHRRFWERRGTVLRAPLAVSLASPEHVFERLVAASERWRAGDRTFVPEFCVEHAQVLADVGRYLPAPGDRSVAAWMARVGTLLQGRTFGLVVDDYQVHDEPVWRRLREFVRGLYALTGLPGEQAKAALFLGNYHRTPFGLHRGRSSNFMFVVDGVKRIRAWPDAFFRGKEDLTNRLDYERYNSASMLLEGAPGDVIYWPSPYWHIGEDAGGPSMAISLALFMAPRPWADLAATVETELVPRLSGAAAEPRRAISALKAVARSPALERALTAARLNHVTGFGFARVPDRASPRTLRNDDLVRGHPEAPVLWARVRDELVCSANGHAFAIRADPRARALLKRLNSGARVRVADLVSAYSGTVERRGVRSTATPRDVRALVERLLSLRALTAEP